MTTEADPMTPTPLAALLQSITGASAQVHAHALAALDAKTKPRGSLGFLEHIAARYASIRHEPLPAPPAFALVVAAADHGVAARNVSAYPAEVTAQMIANIAGGGAAVSVLARQAGARVITVDAGSTSTAAALGVLDVRGRRMSGDIAVEAAMSLDEASRLLMAGADLAGRLAASGITSIGVGEMGIGNSTVAAALTAALLGVSPERVTGRGTGVSDEVLAIKTAMVDQAVRRARSAGATDALGTLAEVGGLEIAFLSGVILGSAARRLPVLIDGYISTAAAIVAVALAPAAGSALIAAHRSTEPGHAIALSHLGLRPILDLDLRLGEGSGAALAMPVVSGAVSILREMATFDSAGVTDTGA